MKKLAAFFIVLISLVIIAGCNKSRIIQNNDSPVEKVEVKTTITKLEDEKDAIPEINIKDESRENEKEPSEPVNKMAFEISEPQETKPNGQEDLASTGASLNLLISTMISLSSYLILFRKRIA